LIEESLLHNHAPNEKSILHIDKRLVNRNSVKRKWLEDISERLSKLLHHESKNYVHNLTHTDFILVRKNFYNDIKSIHPNIPKNIDDDHNVLKWFKSNNESRRKCFIR